MHCVAIRISSLVTVYCAVLLTCCSFGNAQDPPVRDLRESQDSAAAPPDDPIMRAIQERAVLTPEKIPNASETRSKPPRKADDRWRIAERLLRQARIMERDAESLQQLGDADAANALRQLAATTREQVIRILQPAAQLLQEKREPNLPLRTMIP